VRIQSTIKCPESPIAHKGRKEEGKPVTRGCFPGNPEVWRRLAFLNPKKAVINHEYSKEGSKEKRIWKRR